LMYWLPKYHLRVSSYSEVSVTACLRGSSG
jgi:hypothetical protein